MTDTIVQLVGALIQTLTILNCQDLVGDQLRNDAGIIGFGMEMNGLKMSQRETLTPLQKINCFQVIQVVEYIINEACKLYRT